MKSMVILLVHYSEPMKEFQNEIVEDVEKMLWKGWKISSPIFRREIVKDFERDLLKVSWKICR